jgi:Flp pilus assembly pilin Flp
MTVGLMNAVTEWCRGFWRDEAGQGLIEYTLLMTFIVLATFAFIGSGRPMVNAIWGTANSQLVTANHTSSGH